MAYDQELLISRTDPVDIKEIIIGRINPLSLYFTPSILREILGITVSKWPFK